jgi:hypothetical protein
MKKVFVLLLAFSFVSIVAYAQNVKDLNPNAGQFMVKGWARPGGGGAQNLNFHSGGRVLLNAHSVCIFWGPSFAAAGSADNTYAQTIQAFRNQFGTTPEYNVITQYYGYDDATNGTSYGNIAQTNLAGGTADWFDTTTPPTNVTDAVVQSEVQSYVATHGVDYGAIYEVFIPSTSYSSSGTSTSCGGPSLAYCAYHSHYVDGASRNVKYSIEPYPGCSGCQVSGWSTAQNQEHFVCHETREAVTDALGNAWFDNRGYEADDKCAWSPSPFFGTGGYGYQYEWSNANSGCVKTR